MNCWRDLVKCREVTWHGVASYLGDQRYSFTFRATKIEVDRILWCGKLGTWANFTILDIISITNGTAKRKSEKRGLKWRVVIYEIFRSLVFIYKIDEGIKFAKKVIAKGDEKELSSRGYLALGIGYSLLASEGAWDLLLTLYLPLWICQSAQRLGRKHSQLMKICFRNFPACLLSVREERVWRLFS